VGERVASNEVVIRFVNKMHYVPGAPEGSRLIPAHMKSDQFAPPSRPSLFVKSVRSLSQLEEAWPKWSLQGVIEIEVGDLERMGLRVVFSPEDCNLPSIRDAHASLEGVTGENRDQVVDLLASRLVRPPRAS
jgi:hypothetical protein